MRGLMTEHGLNPDDYLEYVHQIDDPPLRAQPRALGAALERLPGRKLTHVNGTTAKHAEAVMRRLEIHHHFEDVFDIAAADLDPKPLPQVYERFLSVIKSTRARARCSRICARNLVVPHALAWSRCWWYRKGSAKFSGRRGNSRGGMRRISIT